MGSQSPETRCKVHLRYKEMFDKDLADLMKSEAGRKPFGQALQLLAVDPVMAECMMIKMACKGIGTKELSLCAILCGRTNKEIQFLKKKFFDMYSEDLGRVLDSELGGGLETLVFSALQASQEEYDVGVHTADKMKADCKTLKKQGLGTFGTNEAGLFKIICQAPPKYLKELNMCYAEMYGFTLAKALEKELSGIDQDVTLFLMGMKMEPYEEVAKLIDKACKGFGTNELLLITILIRYQSIMKEVALAHVELYSQTIQDRVKKETGGDFEALLLKIIKTGEEL
jgi:annexin A7/11